MNNNKHRKALQWVIGILALAPLFSGLVGLSGIYNPLFTTQSPPDLILDSNLRFLNAMSVVVALSFYFIMPVIEKETFAFRIICCSVFFGGVGRLISFFHLGTMPIPLLFILLLELAGPLVIMYWQQQTAAPVSE